MFGLGRKEKDHNAQTLSDIARGIQHSVNTAQEIVERHYIQILDRYFKPDRTPLTVKIMVTENHEMEIPLIALINPSGLSLFEMNVAMSVRVDEAVTKPARHSIEKLRGKPGEETKGILGAELEDGLSRTSFSISLAPPTSKEKGRQSNVIDVVMKFKAGDPPEGISRIIDEFTSKILPRESTPVNDEAPDRSGSPETGEEGGGKP